MASGVGRCRAFTVLSPPELEELSEFFRALGTALHRVLVPGGHLFIASNPLLSTLTFHALQSTGLEKRGEVVRLVQTLRGGDRPKGAEGEFADVSVMARSAWEPWGIFRKPLDGTVAANLRRWGTGGLRRIGAAAPFKDVIASAPTGRAERALAPHPSLKPQAFLRQVVRAAAAPRTRHRPAILLRGAGRRLPRRRPSATTPWESNAMRCTTGWAAGRSRSSRP